jgi:hypothetical protein
VQLDSLGSSNSVDANPIALMSVYAVCRAARLISLNNCVCELASDGRSGFDVLEPDVRRSHSMEAIRSSRR